MDRPPLPTAADLGISEEEYDAIVRDMRRKGFRGPLPPPPPSPSPAHPRSVWGLLLVVAVALAGLVVVMAVTRPAPEPEYAFLRETVGGNPVTYTSCKLIQVAVYPAGGPPDAEELVREAVAKVRVATGLDIRVVGAFGGHAPNWDFDGGPVHPEDPISVSWQDGDAIAALSDHVRGLGGSSVVTGRNGVERYVAGTIALSRDHYASMYDQGDRDLALAVLLHELGHVLGLAHVESEREIMHGSGVEVTTFGPGDREGLRRLGQGPCM